MYTYEYKQKPKTEIKRSPAFNQYNKQLEDNGRGCQGRGFDGQDCCLIKRLGTERNARKGRGKNSTVRASREPTIFVCASVLIGHMSRRVIHLRGRLVRISEIVRNRHTSTTAGLFQSLSLCLLRQNDERPHCNKANHVHS